MAARLVRGDRLKVKSSHAEDAAEAAAAAAAATGMRRPLELK